MVLLNFSWAAGATCTLSQRQIAVQMTATPQSEMHTRGTLIPFARRAINSLSAESRPNTSRIAANNPHGLVKISENGNTHAMKVIRYSIGTSCFTSKGSSLREISPSTSTRLNTDMENATVTISSRLTKRSINFIFCRTREHKSVAAPGCRPENPANCSYQNLDNLVSSTDD